jgi:hypothetical protein
MGRRLNIHYFPFRSRYRGWILVVIAIVMTIAVHTMTPHIKVATAPRLQAWQMDGIVATLADQSPEVRSIALAKIHEFEPSDLQKFPTQSDQIAAYAIAQLKNLDEVKMKPYSLGRQSYAQLASVLERLGKIDNSIVKLLTEGIEKSKDEYNSFKVEIARILVNTEKADADIIKLLIDRAKDSRPDVTFGQDSAIYALETLGKSDPKIVDFLFDRFRNAEIFKSKAAAAEVLINLNKQDESVMKLLLEKIKKPMTGNITDTFRSQALSALGNLKKADSATIDLLFNLFTGDDYDSLQGASNALVSLGKFDDSIVKRLSEILTNPQKDSRIRYKASIMLGKIHKTDSRVLPVLEDLIRKTEDLPLSLSAAKLLVDFQAIDRNMITFLSDTIVTSNSIAARDRIEAAKILGEIQSLDPNQLGTFMRTPRDADFPDMDERRFLTYYYNRGHHDLNNLLKSLSD